MGKGMETFVESLAQIPGLGFLQNYANDMRNARYAVRSHRERAEEIAGRTKYIKPPGMKGKDKAKDPGKGKASPETSKDIRKQTRKHTSDNFGGQVKSTPTSSATSGMPLEGRGGMRDTSPDRDKGRSLRKRKEEF